MVDSGIRAIDIMTTEIVIAYPEMNIVEVSELMNRFRIGGIPVAYLLFKDIEDKNMRNFFIIAIAVLGLAEGLRNLISILII